MTAIETAESSAWSPLRRGLFRILWIASVVSNLGTWIHNVGAAWLMTSLTPSPGMVAAIQAASSLPLFLLALPAGALADVVDRRRLLIFTQAWMLVAAGALGVQTVMGAATTWSLLAFTFLLGLGSALNSPAWQAITPELVPRAELPAAVALGSISFNLSRAVGPALGGVIVAAAGAGSAFLVNAASFLAVIVVIYRWQRQSAESELPAEHIFGALRTGVRYVRHSPPLRAVLVRSACFVVGGSALWALLPLVARSGAGAGAMGYGLLLGCLGVGAILSAIGMASASRRMSINTMIVLGTLVFAGATAATAYLHNLPLLCAAMVAGGVAWVTLLSSFNVAVQMAVPEWVRARALAAYLLVTQGGLALGSVLWGVVAEHAGVPRGLLWAAVELLVALPIAMRFHLENDPDSDLSPSLHWPEPELAIEPPPEHHPVLVTVEYCIDPARADEFPAAMRDVRMQRLRDGAMRWGLFNDSADPARYLETFLVESWIEHLRQHERVTVADRLVEERARSFHIDDAPPRVTHYISTPVMAPSLLRKTLMRAPRPDES